MSEKALVIGSSGFVGSFLRSRLNADGASTSGAMNSMNLDITDASTVMEFFSRNDYELVINCAGMTGVDMCEKNPDMAYKSNAVSAGILNEASERHSFRLIQISTDYVFDGKKGNYSEEDSPNPLNVYGRTKLEGEKNIDVQKNLILRISTPFGLNISRRKKTFMEFIIGRLSAGEAVSAATDQITNPTYLPDILEFVKIASEADLTGIFHLGITDSVSRYSFCLEIARAYDLDHDLIKPVGIEDLGLLATRPKNTTFDLTRVKKIYVPHSLKTSIDELASRSVHS